MNFVAMNTQSTTNVANAPTALIASDFFQLAGAVTSSVTKYDRCMSSSSNPMSANVPEPSPETDTALGALFVRSARSLARSLNQWTTIPDCDKVNERNTPTA